MGFDRVEDETNPVLNEDGEGKIGGMLTFASWNELKSCCPF
jgi:hypothetical protein